MTSNATVLDECQKVGNSFLRRNFQMGVTTLMVDDSESFRFLLRRRLEQIGCTVVGEAGSAAEGLQMFRKLNPRLVTLDLVMPGMEEYSSRDLFADIRKEVPSTGIIVISVQSEVANASQFLGEGALGYLEKSFINFQKLEKRLKIAFPELSPRPRTS